MADDWRHLVLDEVLTLQRGFDLPADQRVEGPVPVIASTGIVGRHNEARVRAPGVVIGRSGSLGGGQYLETDFWPLNTTLWVKDFKGNDPRFCYFLLRSIDLDAFNAGTTVPTLNRNHLRMLPVYLPSLSEQRAIAGLLGALDDKVKVNQQIDRTLDGMAQALFKSWFVDFEPVVARAGENQPYGLADTDVPLFPDGFVDSELGPIPIGWSVDSIVHQVVFYREGVMPSDHPEEIFAHYSIPAFDDTKTPRLEKGATIQSNKYLVPDDSVLLSKLNPEIPRVWLPDRDSAHRRVCSTEFLVCGTKERAFRECFYCLFLDSEFRNEFASRVTGTSKSHQRVRPVDLNSMKIVVPSVEVVRLFTRRVRNWFARAERARCESALLTSLRNSLLPRLLSGTMRLPTAAKLVEQTV